MYVPLFTDFTRSRVLVSTVFTRFTVNPAVTGSYPCFSQKLFRAFFFDTVRLFQFFFDTVRLFDFFTFKGPFKFFFDILQQSKVPKSPKGLPFYVFRHYETVQNSRRLWIFFLSEGSHPPSIYLIFCNKLDFQKARKVPLLQVSKLCAF